MEEGEEEAEEGKNVAPEGKKSSFNHEGIHSSKERSMGKEKKCERKKKEKKGNI